MTDLQKIEQLRKKFESRVGPYKGVFAHFFDELWDACSRDIGLEYEDYDDDLDDDEFDDQVASQFIFKLVQLANALKSMK